MNNQKNHRLPTYDEIRDHAYDPTTDAEEMMGDTGMTGITTDYRDERKNSPFNMASLSQSPTTEVFTIELVKEEEIGEQVEPDIISLSLLENDDEELGNREYNTKEPDFLSVYGEQWASGTNPDPSSDDNMLELVHSMGLYTEVSEEDHPELNIAEQIEKAERARRGL